MSDAVIERLVAERDALRDCLLGIALSDRYRRYPKQHEDGGVRGQSGLRAVRSLTGQHGSYLSDEDVVRLDKEARAMLAASPSVGGWEGSRPQEAVPTEGPGAAVLALKEIIPAVEAYLMSGDDLAQALKRQTWGPALKRARQRAAEGCSSNEGAGK